MKLTPEQETERSFWRRYRRRLTQDERADFARGEHSCLRPKADHLPVPQIPEGEWLEVRAGYRVKLGALQHTPKGYRYEVTHREDFRARIPRRTPGVYATPDMDEHGNPLPPTEAAIADATEAGNYTSSHALSVPDVGEAVDPFTQKRLTREARERETLAVGELLAALEDLRGAVDERLTMHPEARALMGKDAWDLKNKIEAAKRRLRRRHAA